MHKQRHNYQYSTQHSSHFLNEVRETIRLRHLSYATEKGYIGWIKRFIFFHNKRHPKDMGAEEVRQFLSYLATDKQVSASTQNQALNALVFLYKHVIKAEIGSIAETVRAKQHKRLPVVFTREEVHNVLGQLTGTKLLIAELLYGSSYPNPTSSTEPIINI